MKNILLIGDPNVGKSVLFSRLTGADVIVSNYPGTTVDYLKGRMLLDDEPATILDAPGTYSLKTTNKAEKVALAMLEKADLVINVVDATSLERCLLLTLELLAHGKPMLVAVNMWDEARHLGIKLDLPELERLLGVPVVPTVAITGEGIRELVGRLAEARPGDRNQFHDDDRIWAEIGQIVRAVQTVEHRHHSLRDLIVDATVKSGIGWVMAALILFALFWLVRLLGEGLISHVTEPLFNLLGNPLMALHDWLDAQTWWGAELLQRVLIGTLVEGQINFEESMGILTTGLFVPLGLILPYIMAFYFALALLEDSGYLPRLATVTDNMFHKIGLHGHGIVPMLLGLGCKVPGILAARALETRKQRFIAITLVGVTVPCAAHTATIFGILGRYGVVYIMIVFASIALVFVSMGLIFSRAARGGAPELFLDIPPYRWPIPLVVLKKTWMRVRWFLLEAMPLVFLGIVIAGVLEALGANGWLARVATPFLKAWLGLPGEAAPALLSGFLRKEMAVGMLLPLGLTAAQMTVALAVFSFFPCIATLTMMLKELGARDMLKAMVAMLLASLLVGGALRWLLIGMAA